MTIYFPDMAGFQGDMNLAGALVVVAKATEGTGFVSNEYENQKAGAAKAGAYFVAYHFLIGGNAAAQAQHARNVVGGVPLMIDFEPEPQAGSFPSLNDCAEFADAYRSLGGTCHFVYLPHWYWADLGSPSLKPLANRALLLVSSDYVPYTDSSTGIGWQPYGGMTPTVWQYTDRLVFNGQAVDFNAYRGSKYAGKEDPPSVAATLAEYKSLATTGRLPGQAPPPPPPMNEVKWTMQLPTISQAAPGPSPFYVETLQSLLNVASIGGGATVLTVDGSFGPTTDERLKQYQGNHNLAQDGVAGPATWGALTA